MENRHIDMFNIIISNDVYFIVLIFNLTTQNISYHTVFTLDSMYL